MRQFTVLIAAMLGLSACAGAGDLAPLSNAVEPAWDEFAAGELAPPLDQNSNTVEPVKIFYRHPEEPYPVRVRLSSELDTQQVAFVQAALAETQGVVIHPAATHEIAPHPEFFEHLVFYRLKGMGGANASALDPRVDRQGAMTLEDILDYYESRSSNKANAWASNVPVPIDLGRPDRGGFAADLQGHVSSIARRAALLAIGQSGGDYSTTSICLSQQPSYYGVCQIPDGMDWNEVRAGQGNYLSITAKLDKPHYLTAISIAPDGKVSHLLSQWAEFPRYETGAYDAAGYSGENGKLVSVGTHGSYPQDTGNGTPAPAYDAASRDPETAFAATEQPGAVFAQPGRYQVIVMATETPLHPAIWELGPGDAMSDEWCAGEDAASLCSALTGGEPGQSYDWPDNIRTFTVDALQPITFDGYIVNGFPAPAEISKWQVQLFQYRDGGPFYRSTSSPRNNFEKAHKCGGSYIGGGYILTAAHCIREDLSEMRIRLGTRDIVSGGRTFKVHSAAIHTRAKASSRRADIAVIRIDDPGGHLGKLRGKLAAVATAGTAPYNATRYNDLIVTGWGYMSAASPGAGGPVAEDQSVQRNPRLLQGLELLPVPANACTSLRGFGAFRASDILCARGAREGSDACNGDSGGPVTSRVGNRRVLVGVVSVGKGCAQGLTPAIYMKVESYAKWIEKARRELKNARAGSRLKF